MMKALIPILFVLSPLVSAADEPVNLLESKVSFDGNKVRVSEVFGFLEHSLKTSPNIVFKGDTGNHEISSLRVKDVTLGNLFRVLETVADIEIQIVEDHGYLKEGAREDANNDPFAMSVREKFLTSSGIVIVSSTRAPVARISYAQPVAKFEVVKKELMTEVIPVKDLKLPIETLNEVITKTWAGLDENMAGLGNIAYHEEAKLLIVTAPKEGVEIAQKILGALIPEYQKQIDEKKRDPLNLPGVRGMIEEVPRAKMILPKVFPPQKATGLKTEPADPQPAEPEQRAPSDDPFGN